MPKLELVANNRATNAAYDAIQNLTDNLEMRNALGVKAAAEELYRALSDIGVEIDISVAA